ncbi:MAG: cobyric acid synthase, partial [Pseudomonadota bacterium]
EIGRAQALQAQACRVSPQIDFNPVLLKPQGDLTSQLIVHGKREGVVRAHDFRRLRADLLGRVLASYHRLARQYDLVLVEGAGSPAEVNLREGDIANMGFARATNLPVLLVGDIDRGGVLAQITGTHLLLEPADRAHLKGYIINKFRGDRTLFAPALTVIEQQTKLEHFGIVDWFDAARLLPGEDSLALHQGTASPDQADQADHGRRIAVTILRLPHLANFDDFDALTHDPKIDLTWLEPGEALPGHCDLVIIPGSKATMADLACIRKSGWAIDLAAHHRRGGFILGVCGGYQMLGRRIHDPHGIEGNGEVEGLGFLPVDTVMRSRKTVLRCKARFPGIKSAVSAYQIHIGQTVVNAGVHAGSIQPFAMVDDDIPDGAVHEDRRVFGTYLHGFLNERAGLEALMRKIGSDHCASTNWGQVVERTLDQLADQIECDLATNRILELAAQTVQS